MSIQVTAGICWPMPTEDCRDPIASGNIGTMQDYRRLDVWSRAHAQNLSVRNATNQFPKTGYSQLKSQMTRAAESIAFNIVEGCGSARQKEYARFLEIAIKSAFELEYQLLLSKDYGVINESAWKQISGETIEIRRMLYGLRKKVLASLDEPPER
jgi:four helix bundle protein